MIGAIIGDMVGAPYEFDRSPKTKKFRLFSKKSQFTDDSVMTIAVAEALMNTIGKSDEEIKAALVESMQRWGRRYPDAGYGEKFYEWLRAEDPKPYGSFGNGSAMRVSSAGRLFNTLEETRHAARLTAEVTHNHSEGIKGAEATASVIFLARNGRSKAWIKNYVITEFGYDLSRTCDEIRPEYHHVETCRQTVPEAITAFLEGMDFEDVIRTAVSLGGDSDTLTCIAGSMAEAFYGIPEKMKNKCRKRLPQEMLAVIDRFDKIVSSISMSDDVMVHSAADNKPAAELTVDGKAVKMAVEICRKSLTTQNLTTLMAILHKSRVFIPCSVVMSSADNNALDKMVMAAKNGEGIDSLVGKTFTANDEMRLIPDIMQNGDDFFFPVFTSAEEMGEYSEIISKVEKNFPEAAKLALNNENNVKGVVINAFTESFVIPRDLLKIIAK